MLRTMRLSVALALLSLFIGLNIPSVYAQQADRRLFISEINRSKFPEIQFSFYALNGANQIESGLSDKTITVLEDDRPVEGLQITPVADAPLSVVFVVDSLYFISNMHLPLARDAMKQLITSGTFRNGIDTVSVVVESGDKAFEAIPPLQDGNAFAARVDALEVHDVRHPAMNGIDLAITQLKARQGFGTVVYLSRVIETDKAGSLNPSISNVTGRAREAGVRIYSLHLDTRLAEAFQTLAAQTGGQYLALSTKTNNQAGLDGIYRHINGQRARYTAIYRSRSGKTGERRVAVISTGDALPASNATNVKTYQVMVQPPVIKIAEPANSVSIDRVARANPDGTTWSFGLNSTIVKVNLIWSDGISRKIESVDLLIDGSPAKSLPNPGGTYFEIPWDLSEFTVKGDNPRTLQVRVRDELRLEGSDAIAVRVKVDIPEGELFKSPPVIEVRTPCEKDASSMACIQDSAVRYLPVVGFIVAMALLFKTRRELRAIAGNATGMATQFVQTQVKSIRQTILGQHGDGSAGTPLAWLEVIDGPYEQRGQEIEIHANITKLGRDPQRAEVLFYRPSDESTVSGLHCTLTHQSGRFMLVDNESSNGTMVNHQRCAPNQSVELKDNTEIVLGNIRSHGARLIFRTQPAKTNVATQLGDSDEDTVVEKPAPRITIIQDDETETVAPPPPRQSPISIADIDTDIRARPNNGKTKRPPVDDSWMNDL